MFETMHALLGIIHPFPVVVVQKNVISFLFQNRLECEEQDDYLLAGLNAGLSLLEV